MSAIFNTPCATCGAELNSNRPCLSPSGAKRGSHQARIQTLKRMTSTHEGVVRILADDPGHGLTAGEEYAATPYWLDPGTKVTLLRRLSDGWDPSCNAYNSDIEFVRWGAALQEA